MRLGHARVLTPHRGVIHCARAALLPHLLHQVCFWETLYKMRSLRVEQKIKRLPIQRIRTRDARYHLISHATERSPFPAYALSHNGGHRCELPKSRRHLPPHRSKATFNSLPPRARTNRPFSESSKDLLLFFNAFRKVYHKFLRMSTPNKQVFIL